MDWNMILNIAQILLYILLGGLAVWFKNNAALKGKAVELINTAESIYSDTTKAGGKRFEWVVNRLYEMLPIPIRAIVPKTFIETIVQNTFDQMKEFAKQTLDKQAGKFID